MARGVRSASTRHRHHALNRPAVNNGLDRTITFEVVYFLFQYLQLQSVAALCGAGCKHRSGDQGMNLR
jgi:hypothetical protein